MRHMPVVVMIIATVLGGAALNYTGHETPAIVALAVLGVIGLGLDHLGARAERQPSWSASARWR